MVPPALYALPIAMLLALVFRGVAFEFRWRTVRAKPVWDRAFAGGWSDWLTPFSLLAGVALVIGCTMLGSTWLVMKTDGVLRLFARRAGSGPAIATLMLIGVVTITTPFPQPAYLERWIGWPTIAFSIVVPLLVLGRRTGPGRDLRPATGPRRPVELSGAADRSPAAYRGRDR